MRIVDPGHVYELQNVDGDGVQTIRFVRRRDDEALLLGAELRTEGVLFQEVVRMLVDRINYLNAEGPCAETVAITECLRRVIQLGEIRAARRTIEKHPMIERMDVCEECQHALCTHRGFGKAVKDIDLAGGR
jgi:hypothetical protein